MTPQDLKLEWRARNVPVSLQFDDPYYSLESGFEESKHVFLNANSLPERLHDGFSIAELGFGTGLNFLTLLDSWRRIDRPGRLLFTSFEAFPLSATDMIKAQAAFPMLETLSAEFAPLWETLLTTGKIETTDITLRLVQGDARLSLPLWQGAADCWFLDGFSPAKNPELWQADLLQALYDKTQAGGSASTYSAAGEVRRNLQAAGFKVARLPGFGRKRHMSLATKGLIDAE